MITQAYINLHDPNEKNWPYLNCIFTVEPIIADRMLYLSWFELQNGQYCRFQVIFILKNVKSVIGSALLH